MAHMTPAVRRAFPYADYVPDDVLRRLSQAELADRLVFSSQRAAVAKRAATPGRQREITQAIIAMMAAPPRAVVGQEVKARISKAAAAADAFQGSALRRSAQDLLTSQPPAPHNPDSELIVKAAAGEDGLMACYDESGCIVGVCPQSALTPIVLPGQVAKTRAPVAAVAKAAPAGHVEAYDEKGAFLGYVKPGVIAGPATAQARDTGPVRAGGTTGMGQPRRTGPAASLPADGPQQARPGDVPDRRVVKSAADVRALQEAGLRDYARQLAASQAPRTR